MNKPKWKQFESTIAKIHKDLFPHAKVTHDVKLLGKSGRKRQVDVLIEGKLGIYPFRMIVESKAHKRKIGIETIDALIGKMEDVNANSGIIVSLSGFQQGATEWAKKNRISLVNTTKYTPPWVRVIEYNATAFRTYMSRTDGNKVKEYPGITQRPTFVTPKGCTLTDIQLYEQEIKNGTVNLEAGIVKHSIADCHFYRLIDNGEELKLSFIGVEFNVVARCYEGILPTKSDSYVLRTEDGDNFKQPLEFETPDLLTLPLVHEFSSEEEVQNFVNSPTPADHSLLTVTLW